MHQAEPTLASKTMPWYHIRGATIHRYSRIISCVELEIFITSTNTSLFYPIFPVYNQLAWFRVKSILTPTYNLSLAFPNIPPSDWPRECVAVDTRFVHCTLINIISVPIKFRLFLSPWHELSHPNLGKHQILAQWRNKLMYWTSVDLYLQKNGKNVYLF